MLHKLRAPGKTIGLLVEEVFKIYNCSMIPVTLNTLQNIVLSLYFGKGKSKITILREPAPGL